MIGDCAGQDVMREFQLDVEMDASPSAEKKCSREWMRVITEVSVTLSCR